MMVRLTTTACIWSPQPWTGAGDWPAFPVVAAASRAAESGSWEGRKTVGCSAQCARIVSSVAVWRSGAGVTASARRAYTRGVNRDDAAVVAEHSASREHSERPVVEHEGLGSEPRWEWLT